ncbi:hypothetical protein BH10PSE6_BH10PSE6_16930 [soil metagenome]
MKRLALMAVLALALSGFETAQTTSDDVVPKYQGKPVDLVLQRWGAPSRALRTDGGTIYLYENAMPARNARVEVHADDRGNTLGIKCFGTGPACPTWLKMLR